VCKNSLKVRRCNNKILNSGHHLIYYGETVLCLEVRKGETMSEITHYGESFDCQWPPKELEVVPPGMRKVVAAIIINGPDEETIWGLRPVDPAGDDEPPVYL
jgi:hypothetical protein